MIGILLLLTLGESTKIFLPQESPIQSMNFTQEVGYNCGSTTIYSIFGVDVSSWPPTPSASAVVSMGGIFLMNAVVQNFIYAIFEGGINIANNNVAMNNIYYAGQEVIFEIEVTFPAISGAYSSIITLEGGGMLLCCWTFSYNIY